LSFISVSISCFDCGDNNGNLKQKTAKVGGGITIYHYDAENKFVRVELPNATTVNYKYDGLDRRVAKEVIGGTMTVTRYVYDNEDILLELDGINNIVARYTHGPGIDEPLVMEKGGQNYFYHADGLGSITEITNQSGTPVQRYTYSSFGEIESQLDANFVQPYTYTSRELDTETGLYFYRARYYDPAIGRFLSEDPIGLLEGPNLYGYVDGNPITFTDPLGLFGWRDAANFVPILGSSLDAYDSFQCGNIAAGIFHTGLAVLDMTGAAALAKGLTVGSFKLGARTALKEVYGEGLSLAWDNVRKRMLRRGLVDKGVAAHHWGFSQASDVADWLKNHPANLMPNISKFAHDAFHYGNLPEKLWYGTPSWAKFAVAGMASYTTGLFVNCECRR
jgi:RHS repeat-associated protein